MYKIGDTFIGRVPLFIAKGNEETWCMEKGTFRPTYSYCKMVRDQIRSHFEDEDMPELPESFYFSDQDVPFWGSAVYTVIDVLSGKKIKGYVYYENKVFSPEGDEMLKKRKYMGSPHFTRKIKRHNMIRQEVTYYTDYPFHSDDSPGEIAPIREVKVIAYDHNKYCTVKYEGKEYRDIKLGYIYRSPIRRGEGLSVSHADAVKMFTKETAV